MNDKQVVASRYYWSSAVLKTELGDIEVCIYPDGDIGINYNRFIDCFIYVDGREYEFEMQLSPCQIESIKNNKPFMYSHMFAPALVIKQIHGLNDENIDFEKEMAVINKHYHEDEMLIKDTVKKAMIKFYNTKKYKELLKESKREKACWDAQRLEWASEEHLKESKACKKEAERLIKKVCRE